MDADIGTEYDQLYKPFKYFTFAIRNGLKDYQISKDNGFFVEEVTFDQKNKLDNGNEL
jgi:hypothetical protein